MTDLIKREGAADEGAGTGRAKPVQAHRLVPLERLLVDRVQIPESLNGRFGANRNEMAPQIAANTDLEAVQSWLLEYQDSPETFRSYRREAERLILWCWYQQGKALSDLNRQDIADYQAFIKKPEPEGQWCGEPCARTSPDWKPFKRGLSANSQKQTITILKGLFSYLRDADYLRGNPFALIRQKQGQSLALQQSKKVERYLEQTDIQLMFKRYEAHGAEIEASSGKSEREFMREKTLLYFLYYLAPRVSEVASCRMGDFFLRRGRWWWRVLGKGKKYAEIPVPEPLMAQVRRYRAFLGLSPEPEVGEEGAFIRSTRGTNSISANMIYRLSKKILKDTADSIEEHFPESAARMRAASTHWFRHTAITHLADRGIDLRLVSKTARHSQLETTAVYFHTEEEAWHDAINPADKVE
ncbi:tyrosine-type recombinase/integrase [Oceanospirillum sp.]|uniref:tyrosine-type recombinase/integrase n=1 Tax=Oceanospirillum sp. TaxID=2021254 RepID=UPI003A8D9EBB